MPSLRKILCCLFFGLFIYAVPQTVTERPNYLFSPFFAEKDLSSEVITCIFQDSKGYMWIGTEDGLNYFNGKTIRIFKHDHLDKSSLAGNTICSISEDKQGSIWVATNQGISKLNTERLTFKNYYVDDTGAGLGFKSYVYVDKDGICWAYSGDLYRFDPQQDHFKKLPIPSDHLYTGIYQDTKKRYWLSASDGLYRFFPNDNKRIIFSHFKKKVFFFAVKEDKHGNLVCGTWGEGIYQIHPELGTLDTIERKGVHGTYDFQELEENSVLWYGNMHSSYNLNDHRVVHYQENKNDPDSKRNRGLAFLFTDAQNQLWIGYSREGIQLLSPSNQFFKTYTVAEKKSMFPTVHLFITTPEFSYAGGWYNYSLVKLDKNNHPIRYWKSLLPEYPQSENNLSDVWSDGRGNLWFTSAYGLIRFNMQTEKTALFKLDSSVTKRSFFLRMLAEGDSALWLSGYFCGLSRFSIRNQKFENWGADVRALYWDITKDNEGIIWLADNSGPLTGFDPKRKTFIIKNYNYLTGGVTNNSILFDSISNVLWIAGHNGVLRIDRKTFAAKLYNEKNNLPSSQANAIQIDKLHRLWIATNKGLCMFDPKHDIFKNFFSNNGLPSNILDQLFKIEPNGDLYIGCSDGFSVLETNALRFGDPERSVSIARVYESGKLLSVSMNSGQKEIELNYDQNNLQIELSSNDLINPEDNRLQFRLEGYDETWHTTRDGIVNYSKLAPGKYLLHASGVNHNGVKFAQDDFLSIVIYPPYWKSTWFLTLITILLFSLTLFAARYVFTRNLREKILILEKEQAVEKERSRISQDMHDELGSGLTKISIMSEVAKTQLTEPSRAQQQLEHISSSSRELVDNLQDIIWILNSRNDSLENLCAYVREYALKYFEHFNIDVQVHFPDKISTLKLSEDQRRNILLVFKESFNNIGKHSRCSKVVLKMTEEKNQISFMITDNGDGFERAEIRNFANGLFNMEKRMNSINGKFAIHSTKHAGTITEFEFET